MNQFNNPVLRLLLDSAILINLNQFSSIPHHVGVYVDVFLGNCDRTMTLQRAGCRGFFREDENFGKN